VLPPWECSKMENISENSSFQSLSYASKVTIQLNSWSRCVRETRNRWFFAWEKIQSCVRDTVKNINYNFRKVCHRISNMGWDLQMYISARPLVKSSSERLSKTNQAVSIGLERLQYRLQDPNNAKNPQNLALWPQEYYHKLIDTTKPTSWECFVNPNDPTSGRKFTQTKSIISLEQSVICAPSCNILKNLCRILFLRGARLHWEGLEKCLSILEIDRENWRQ